MKSNNAISDQPHSIQQKLASSFKSIKVLSISSAIFFIAVASGIGGYWLGAKSSQILPQSKIISQSSSQRTITIAQSSPITTQQPTFSLLPNKFVDWKTHTSSHGYSIKYPGNIEFSEGDYFDFQLENQDLLITFIVLTLAPERDIEDYSRNSFCFAKKNNIRKEKLNDMYIYRREKVYNRNNICLQATIDLGKKQIVDIQGKASNQTAVDLFNKIVSTFQITPQYNILD